MNKTNTFKKFDKFLFPVTILGNDGKIVYKNSVASKYKCFRIGVLADRLFTADSKKHFDALISESKSCILTCNSKTYLTYAAAFRYSDDCFAVFYIMNSTIYRNIADIYADASPVHIKGINDSVISTYKQMCQTLNDETKSKADKILRINSEKFARANRHFSLLINCISKLSDDYPLLNINRIASEVMKYIDETVAPLGFKANITLGNHDFLTRVSKESFICTFLTLVTLSMRLSDDNSVDIDIRERDFEILFSFRFESADIENAKELYKDEFDFLKKISTIRTWKFFGVDSLHDKLCEISLSIPIKFSNDKIFIKTPSPDIPDALLADIVVEELAELL